MDEGSDDSSSSSESDASSSSSEDEEDAAAKKKKKRKTKDSSAQTGGVGGKKAPPKKVGATLGGAAAKMKLAVTLLEGMQLKPYFRRLLLNYATMEVAEKQEPLTVVEGTDIRRVSKERLLEERKVLEACDLRDPQAAEEALRLLDCKRAKEQKRRDREKQKEKGKESAAKKRRTKGTAGLQGQCSEVGQLSALLQ